MEVLAPAGSMDSLKAAVAAGADAVYLGYTAFSARAGAGNFDRQQLQEAVRFCHLRGVRVHAAFNTLIKDTELPDALQVLRILAEAHVDALLIQDLGILRMVRHCLPDMAVHASTQMAIHNATGAKWCLRKGMRRVVLARECSLDEITACCKVPIEIEVFVHGAQCVAVSGECLFSSMLGERSGNRGRCAQPCRLSYTLNGAEGKWLSPRDVCLRDDLPALQRAGVASLKIEGRLKPPAYVAGVTHAYAQAARAAEQNRFQPMDDAEKRKLAQLFNRGFMRGYAFGVEDAAFISPDGNTHRGIPVGRVTAARGRSASVLFECRIGSGDELKLTGTQEPVYMTWREAPVEPGNTVSVPCKKENPLRVGSNVVRLTDAVLTEHLEAIPPKLLKARAKLEAIPGSPLMLTLSSAALSVTRCGAAVETAQKAALSEDDILRQLKKTGDTAFSLESAEIHTENAFVPVSAINALRREAFSALEEALLAEKEKEPAFGFADLDPKLPASGAPNLFLFRDEKQLFLMPNGFLPVWQPEDWRMEALDCQMPQLPEGVWLHLPMTCEESTLQSLRQFTARWERKLGGLLLGSVGQLGLEWPVPVAAGPGIPVMNRMAAAQLLEDGCSFVTASQELSGSELQLLMRDNPPIVVWAYGRTQMMLLHHCPARTRLGLTQGHSECRLCDLNSKDSLRSVVLTDRKNVTFPMTRQRLPEGCVVQLFNSVPTDLCSQIEKKGWPVLYSLIDEYDLSAGEAATSGHWRRPVE